RGQLGVHLRHAPRSPLQPRAPQVFAHAFEDEADAPLYLVEVNLALRQLLRAFVRLGGRENRRHTQTSLAAWPPPSRKAARAASCTSRRGTPTFSAAPRQSSYSGVALTTRPRRRPTLTAILPNSVSTVTASLSSAWRLTV